MQEVTIRLRFSRECLGNVQRRGTHGQTTFCMLRDSDNRVMFLASWWHRSMKYAAQVAGRKLQTVVSIAWDPLIDGSTQRHRRVITPAHSDSRGRMRYAIHEAFVAGSQIGVNAVLPDGMTIEEFSVLLNLVGRYRGISPFVGIEETYGTFEVISVKPATRPPAASVPQIEKDAIVK